MAGSLGSLTVTLGLDAAEFISGFSKTEHEARRALGSIERQAREATDAIKTGLKGAFTLVGLDLSARALVDFTKATFGAIDALNDAADAIPQDRVKTRQASNDATAAGLCLTAPVPDWLIRALDRGQDAPRVRLEVFNVADEHELSATLAMKRADVELRILMPLDDAGVQAFFRYGLRGGGLRLALETEDDELSADVVVGINLGNGRELERLLRKARCLDGSLTRLTQLAGLMSSAVSMPSVQVDNCVSDVVVVLASNRAHAMVATASSLQATPPAM